MLKLKLKLLPSHTTEDKIYGNNNMAIELFIENISGEDLSDITVNIDLPEQAKFATNDSFMVYDEDSQITKAEDNKLEVYIPKLSKDGTKQTVIISALLKIYDMDISILKDQAIFNASAQIGDET